jgi:hypothetical protein
MMPTMLPSHDPRHLLRMSPIYFRRYSAKMSATLPVSILAFSRVLSRQRLRHFPRESLIARLSPGEASIVKVEVAGHYGETTLTTHSKPHNRRAIHAEPKAYLARMRDVEMR